MALGDIEAANSDFQQVLDLNPFNEDACILSGQLLIEQKKYDEAIAFFDEAIVLVALAPIPRRSGRSKLESHP